MERFTRTAVEVLFLLAVVVAVAVDAVLSAVARKGLVDRDAQPVPAPAK